MQQWIFRDLSLTWEQGKSYAITGPNGSGKSTLTSVLMGLSLPTKGKVSYKLHGKAIEADQWYRHLNLAAPYQELVEEFTLQELLSFHFQFKKIKEGCSLSDLLEIMYLKEARNKTIRAFSSGMKQRLKLGLAFYSEGEVLFLDEPTSNLDDRAKQWYHQQLGLVTNNRLVVIASNDPAEYAGCETILNVADYCS